MAFLKTPSKRELFGVLVLEGLVGLHRTVQFQLLHILNKAKTVGKEKRR